MEIFGIGFSELIFILIIAVIALGPKDMQKTGRALGRWLNKMNRSELWQTLRNASNELSHLPNKLMREANLEDWEAEQDLLKIANPHERKPISLSAQPLSPLKTPDHISSAAAPEEEPSSSND